MSEFSRFTPLVQSLPATVPFVGPETQERQAGRPFRARIGANESGFGPAPSVKAAMAAGAGDVWQYCDPENHDLREALALHLGVASDRIVVGESGLSTPADLARMARAGVETFLIGESLMRAEDVAAATRALLADPARAA